MRWHDLKYKPTKNVFTGLESSYSSIPDGGMETAEARVVICDVCDMKAYWVSMWNSDATGDDDRYLWRQVQPPIGEGPAAHPDMPADVRADYDEARTIISLSPRGACALLRLGVQKLCKHLGQPGKNINNDIATLVKEGMPVDVQRALDVLRVVGNHALHPGELQLDDDVKTATALFGTLNFIVDNRIAQPKAIQGMYDALPEGALAAIATRDTGSAQRDDAAAPA